MNDEPLAFFLTWPTYGTWLPGDDRGWIEYRQGWKLPDPARVLESKAKMTEHACMLTITKREIVEAQVLETCTHRGWKLHAVSCRTNHMHIVATAINTHPKKIRIDIKAWCTRRLKEQSNPNRENWWAERGSQRYINDTAGLEGAIIYTLEGQDNQPDA